MWTPREAVKLLLLALDPGILLPGPGISRSLNTDVETRTSQALLDVSSGSLKPKEQSPGIIPSLNEKVFPFQNDFKPFSITLQFQFPYWN